MARTQAADYDKKRESITKRAAKLFARNGFAGTSVSELASHCKVSKSLLYHYYPSKETILYDVMNDHIDALLNTLDETEYGRGDPKEDFRQFTRALLHLYTGAADSQKVLLYELNHLPRAQRNEIVSKQRRLIAFAEQLLSRIAPDLSQNRARRRAQIMLFFGMLNWTHTWFKSTGPISRDELAQMAAETILESSHRL